MRIVAPSQVRTVIEPTCFADEVCPTYVVWEKVYIQAKRWKNTVGSPEIHGFMGALQLQGASKGVFITTSAFSKEAKLAATRARGSIVLIDGEQLGADEDQGIGLSHKALRVPKLDND